MPKTAHVRTLRGDSDGEADSHRADREGRKRSSAHGQVPAPDEIPESEVHAHASSIEEKVAIATARWAADPDGQTTGFLVSWLIIGDTEEAMARALDTVKGKVAEWMVSRGYRVEFL